MSLNINSYFSSIGNTFNGINKNSGQYKAVVKNSLSGIIVNEAMMSDEERLVYEMFGGRDTIIKNKMKMYDANGNLLNADGVAGMDMTGKAFQRNSRL